ncbi:hypothetical protein L0337_15190 [candidate division KSB1 bacterium]|nr:hypothetical protein [candidate division KSB1 bacterium]
MNPDTARNHIFFALKQFFGHIPAGAVRIAASSTNDDLLASAFKHTGKNRAQIVMMNRSTISQKVTVALRNLNVSTFAGCRTSATEKHRSIASAAVVNNKLNITIPANAVVTLDGEIMSSLNLILETHDAPFYPLILTCKLIPILGSLQGKAFL